MDGFYCDNPGSFGCTALGILYVLLIMPLEIFWALVGKSFIWRVEDRGASSYDI
ncbi:MAG TPA: hypothetical protein PLO37_23185 [Candidatus Hydrogenedentes bacterium]|nr:hypothetical protein [Candidatus Hydrogenedentota bacterium]HPG69764.1 hypothetical protein [Candidatus Hydrogenedentota bacterium]